MIGPRKLLLAMIFTFAAAGFAAASTTSTNIYFAQTARGGNNGADCADAYAYNDGSNGINVSGNWVAGNALHLCGTITAPAATQIVGCQHSGSSGNPITVKFESGTILQEPYFGTGSNAPIYLSGCSYITIDGGNTGSASLPTASQAYWTGGVLQAYAAGTSGYSGCPGVNDTGTAACTNQPTNETAIEAMSNVNNITIKNLNCGPIYSVGSSDATNGAPGLACIHFQGSNVTITNDQIHDAGIGIDNTEYGNDTNTVISNNDIQETGWGLGCAGGTHTNTNYQFYGNHLHNFEKPTHTPAHVNGIHCYGSSSGGIQQFYLYNNLFDGNMGTGGWTAWAYFETNGTSQDTFGPNGTLYAFNNIFVSPSNCCVNGNGMLNFGGGTGHVIVNNYFYGTQAQGGPCIDGMAATNLTIENNVCQSLGQLFTTWTAGGLPNASWRTWDYNLYANISGGNAYWAVNSIVTSSFSPWQSGCNCDLHGQAQLSSSLSDITNEGVPSAGFIGIGKGANLSSIATGSLAALAYDTSAGNTRTPLARPSSGAWDIGAYQYSSDPPPAPPTSLTAVVQ